MLSIDLPGHGEPPAQPSYDPGDAPAQLHQVIEGAGTPYRYIAGDEPPPGYRQWLVEQLPAATIEVWPGSGHFPHLARPDEFADQLAATASWATRLRPGQNVARFCGIDSRRSCSTCGCMTPLT